MATKSMKKPKSLLANGWKRFRDQPPPDGLNVLVTNNPKALTAHGQMSHVWLLIPVQSGLYGEWCGYDDGNLRIRDLVAWHSLPGNA
jgi:hypothetical protein